MRLLGLVVATLAFASAQFDPNYNRVVFWHDQLLQAINHTGSSIFWLGEYQHATLSIATHEALIKLGCKHTSRCPQATANLTVDVVGQYILKHYYPALWIPFEGILNAAYAAQPDPNIIATAISVGEQECIKAIKLVDLSGIFGVDPYHFALGVEGRYQPTPPFFTNPSLQQYARAKTMVLPSPGYFVAPAYPSLTSSEFEASVAETRQLGDVNSTTRTLYQTRLARYMDSGAFGGNPEGSIGTFTRIAEQLIIQTNKNMFDSAAIFRVLCTASLDRDFAHMYNKRFVFDTWRPITVIRNGVPSNHNITTDPNWTPLLLYNSNQEYPAGHPTQSYCFVQLLRRFFGSDNWTFMLPSGHADYPYFTFTSLTQFLDDSSGARIWAGLHFRFSLNAAFALSDQVCGYVHDQICDNNSCLSH